MTNQVIRFYLQLHNPLLLSLHQIEEVHKYLGSNCLQEELHNHMLLHILLLCQLSRTHMQQLTKLHYSLYINEVDCINLHYTNTTKCICSNSFYINSFAWRKKRHNKTPIVSLLHLQWPLNFLPNKHTRRSNTQRQPTP